MNNFGSSDATTKKQFFQRSVKRVQSADEDDRDPSGKVPPGNPRFLADQAAEARNRQAMPHADQALS
jgi:hypothetical protein